MLVYCGQTVGCIKMKLGMEVDLGPGHTVLDGDPAALPKRAQPPPQFSAYAGCVQTAGWIKMPLGREIGLSLGHIVLDGDPAPLSPPKKGGKAAPLFGSCLLWPNDWMDRDVTWYGSRPRSRHIVLDGNPAPLLPSPPKGAQ